MSASPHTSIKKEGSIENGPEADARQVLTNPEDDYDPSFVKRTMCVVFLALLRASTDWAVAAKSTCGCCPFCAFCTRSASSVRQSPYFPPAAWILRV